jgi:hypothetical protein
VNNDIVYTKNGYEVLRSCDPYIGYGVEDGDGKTVQWFDNAEEAINWVEEA